MKMIEISFLGQKMMFKASGDPEKNTEVLELVTKKLLSAESRAKNLAPHQIAILALLDLAEDYIQAKTNTKKFKLNMDQKSKELFRLINCKPPASVGNSW